TLRRTQDAQVLLAAGADANLRPVGVAISLRIDRLHFEPVAAVRRHVAKCLGLAAERYNEEIDAAIVVEVGGDKPSADIPVIAERLIRRRNVAELAGSVVFE